MSKVQSWQNAQACELVSKLGITLDDIICRPCRDDIRSVLANCSYIPRWGKRNKLTKCCVKGCPDVCFVHSKVSDACTKKRIFEDKCLETEGNIPVYLPLYVYITTTWYITSFSLSKPTALHVEFHSTHTVHYQTHYLKMLSTSKDFLLFFGHCLFQETCHSIRVRFTTIALQQLCYMYMY